MTDGYGHTEEGQHVLVSDPRNVDPPCPFCEIAAGRAPAKLIHDWLHTMVIEPLNPAVPGHVLVVPKAHVADITGDHAVVTDVFRGARQVALMYRRRGQDVNVITSAGIDATQTVFHLHVHVLPRGADDGLPKGWPWPSKMKEHADAHG